MSGRELRAQRRRAGRMVLVCMAAAALVLLADAVDRGVLVPSAESAAQEAEQKARREFFELRCGADPREVMAQTARSGCGRRAVRERMSGALPAR